MKMKKPGGKAGWKKEPEPVTKVSKKRVAAWGAFVKAAYQDEDKNRKERGKSP